MAPRRFAAAVVAACLALQGMWGGCFAALDTKQEVQKAIADRSMAEDRPTVDSVLVLPHLRVASSSASSVFVKIHVATVLLLPLRPLLRGTGLACSLAKWPPMTVSI